MSLVSICCEIIRSDWDQYKNKFILRDILWDDWYQKHKVDRDDMILLRQVIDSGEEIVLQIDLPARQRIQSLCPKIGLYYKFKGVRDDRLMIVYKPLTWRWEYTLPDKLKYIERGIICDICNKQKGEREMICSPYYETCICKDCNA
jgi:hypothetical protein